MSREDFINNIKIIKNKEEAEIESLQNSFKLDYIKEEDIPKDKLDKLISLYEMQNKDLENKLDEAKIRIRRKINSIK